MFSAAEYRHLEIMLANRPKRVLEAFGMAGVGCLVEVECYHTIKRERPDLALRIVAIAALMGIPETLEPMEVKECEGASETSGSVAETGSPVIPASCAEWWDTNPIIPGTVIDPLSADDAEPS